jgi:hypothetical protein
MGISYDYRSFELELKRISEINEAVKPFSRDAPEGITGP